MILYIKNMTTLSCKMAVEQELRKMGVEVDGIGEGMVQIIGELTQEQRQKLNTALKLLDLEIVDNNKAILVERIKNIIHEMFRLSNELPKLNYSDYLSEKLMYDYTYLANIFMEETAGTIRQFIIQLRIEKAKELLVHNEHSLTEISNILNYSSVGHLSNQFKKVTGVTPTLYKKLKKTDWNLVQVK